MELDVEIRRDCARGAEEVQSFGMAVNSINVSAMTIKKGDVITFDAEALKHKLRQPIRNSFKEVPVLNEQGIEIGTRKEQNKAVYVKLPCSRNGAQTLVNFYPSFFTKSREVVENGQRTGNFKSASGTAVDFVQNYSDMDEAFAALVGKKVEVADIIRFKSLAFGSDTKTRDEWVPVLNFVN